MASDKIGGHPFWILVHNSHLAFSGNETKSYELAVNDFSKIIVC